MNRVLIIDNHDFPRIPLLTRGRFIRGFVTENKFLIPVIHRSSASLVKFSLVTRLPSSIQHPASSIQHPASSIQHPASSIQHPASSIQHPASSIQHPASSIQHPASSIKHQASSIKHPASCS
ncbi:hypothetical protein QUF72_16530 [Desulfobacterales bacterium HSG2]|nr:hypothetical protein [Desulfobacterales bacterium HSG2]